MPINLASALLIQHARYRAKFPPISLLSWNHSIHLETSFNYPGIPFKLRLMRVSLDGKLSKILDIFHLPRSKPSHFPGKAHLRNLILIHVGDCVYSLKIVLMSCSVMMMIGL